jgi:hypothetical protein
MPRSPWLRVVGVLGFIVAKRGRPVKADRCATLGAKPSEEDRMVWRRIFHPEQEPDDPRDAVPAEPAANAQRAVPPHLAERLGLQRREPGSAAEAIRRRLSRLRSQYDATVYDIEQGELAIADDNPWKQRVALLTEALETVEAEYRETERVQPGPYHPVPPVPITGVDVAVENDVARVRYTVGDERFSWEEPLDWAERGHQVTRTELVRVQGGPDAVVPADVPAALRDPLHRHIEHSLFVLATVLRDRTLDDEPLPGEITLAHLAMPCPTCGGWTDYRGRCQACARRAARLHELFSERDRLLNERAAEIEEQHRIAERLPLARRRLGDIEREIEAAEVKLAEADG